MKKSILTFVVAGLLAISCFSAQKKSIAVQGTTIQTTNGYTGLYWNFGTLGRNYVTADTVTFVSDSINNIFIRARDFGPAARNSLQTNLYEPDSMHFCVEGVRTDADDDGVSLQVNYSIDGGNYFPFGTTTATSISTTRTLFCTVQPFVPMAWLKPQFIVTAATDTPKVYSAIMWNSFK